MTDSSEKCKGRVEVYSRVCGFFRPVQGWNPGKRAEYEERLVYQMPRQAAERKAG